MGYRNEVHLIETKAFITVLTEVRDLGRTRREAGVDDPELMKVAARAHAALKWFEADTELNLETAQKWLDQIFGSPDG